MATKQAVYDASAIQALKGLEPVRRMPGMYTHTVHPLHIIQEAIDNYLEPQGISCEVIDVRTLLPFDVNHMIVESLKKTNRIVFIDEDVPGGASAYMFQQVMEIQGGYKWLDVAPRTLAAQAHRPAYATDGDYFSKPNAEDIAKVIEEMMAE